MKKMRGYKRAYLWEEECFSRTGKNVPLFFAKNMELGADANRPYAPTAFVLNEESTRYLSRTHQARQIVNWISGILASEHLNAEDLAIVDATANVGGDTMQFGNVFSAVYAVEMDEVAAFCLGHNVRESGLQKKVRVDVGDCLELVPDFVRRGVRVVYADPPWGSDYKQHQKVSLSLGKAPARCLLKKIRKAATQPVHAFLKVPLNYDEAQFGGFIPKTKRVVLNHKGLPSMIVLHFKIERSGDRA